MPKLRRRWVTLVVQQPFADRCIGTVELTEDFRQVAERRWHYFAEVDALGNEIWTIYSERKPMSYKCELCTATVPPRVTRQRHVEYRLDGQIERELDVCNGCRHQLQGGASVAYLLHVNRPQPTPVPAPLVVPAPVHAPFAPAAPTLAASLVERWKARGLFVQKPSPDKG